MGYIFIHWHDGMEDHEIGPFLTLSPDGNGFLVGQSWIAYMAQNPNGEFERITVPKYHFIFVKG